MTITYVYEPYRVECQERCFVCDGTGVVYITSSTYEPSNWPCEKCHGKGWVMA